MRTKTMILVVTAALLLICGVLPPVKPVAPAGCKEMTAVCECDRHGQHCKWVWQCVH